MRESKKLSQAGEGMAGRQAGGRAAGSLEKGKKKKIPVTVTVIKRRRVWSRERHP